MSKKSKKKRQKQVSVRQRHGPGPIASAASGPQAGAPGSTEKPDATDPRLKGNVEVEAMANGRTVKVRLDGSIGGFFGTTAEDFIGSIEAASKAPARIIVEANSGGGSVVEAVKIYNYLRASKAKVEVRGVGVMGSAMTIIGQAADIRALASNALYLVHEGSSFAAGNVRDLESGLKLLKIANKVMARTYAARMGMTEEEITEQYLSGGDHWMDAEEALANGFIDEIDPLKDVEPHVSPTSAKAKWHMSQMEADQGPALLNAAIKNIPLDSPIFGDNPEDYGDDIDVLEAAAKEAAPEKPNAESTVEPVETPSQEAEPEANRKTEKESEVDFEAYLSAIGQADSTGEVREALKAAWAAKYPIEAKAAGNGDNSQEQKGEKETPAATVAATVAAVVSDDVVAVEGVVAKTENPFTLTKMIKDVLGNDLKYADLAADAFEKGMSAVELRAAKDAVDANIRMQELEAKVKSFEEGAPAVGQLRPRVHYEDGAKATLDQLSVAVQMSSGADPEKLEKHAGISAETINKAMDRFNGIGMMQAISHIMLANGADVSVTNNATQTWKAYQRAERQGMLSASGTGAGWSTLNLPSLAEDICNREIKTKAAMVQSCISEFAEEVEVADLRDRKIIDYNMRGNLTKVNKTGEIEHATMSESRYSASADMYAKMLTIPEQCIINDDLGVFSEIGRNWGDLYICSRDTEFYRALLKDFGWEDGVNRIIGADAEFGTDALDLADDKYSAQLDGGGKPILVDGRNFLGSNGSMLRKVNRYNTAQYLAAPNPSAVELPQENAWQGYFDMTCGTPWLSHADVWSAEDLSEERMAKFKVPDGAEKIWFIFPNPSRHAAMRITYLQGYRLPRIEFQPTAFNTLGMQSRVVAAYGFDKVADIGPIMMDPDDVSRKIK